MDPMSAATAFATIVSLLADFVGHRGANESKSFEEFMVWLSEQRRDEIKTLLELNTSTTIGIKALLGESQGEILERLQSLDRSMATFAAGFDAYRGLAEAAHPTSLLSEQSVSLLEQLYDSGGTTFLECEYLDGTKTLPVLDALGNINLLIVDPRFLKDDLTTLIEFGLLDLNHNGKGQRLLSLKRTGARFVESRRAA